MQADVAATPEASADGDQFASPAAKKMAAESGLNLTGLTAVVGMVDTKEDVAKALGSGPAAEDPAPIETPVPIAQPPAQTPSAPPPGTMLAGSDDERVERRVPMPRLRLVWPSAWSRPSKTPLC